MADPTTTVHKKRILPPSFLNGKSTSVTTTTSSSTNVSVTNVNQTSKSRSPIRQHDFDNYVAFYTTKNHTWFVSRDPELTSSNKDDADDDEVSAVSELEDQGKIRRFGTRQQGPPGNTWFAPLAIADLSSIYGNNHIFEGKPLVRYDKLDFSSVENFLKSDDEFTDSQSRANLIKIARDNMLPQSIQSASVLLQYRLTLGSKYRPLLVLCEPPPPANQYYKAMLPAALGYFKQNLSQAISPIDVAPVYKKNLNLITNSIDSAFDTYLIHIVAEELRGQRTDGSIGSMTKKQHDDSSDELSSSSDSYETELLQSGPLLYFVVYVEDFINCLIDAYKSPTHTSALSKYTHLLLDIYGKISG